MSDAPIVQVNDDGSVIYRASALGMCDTALVAARQGYVHTPPPRKLQEVYDAGHAAEEEYFNSLPLRQVTASRQRLVQLAITSKVAVVGHLDGEEELWIDEVKSQSDNVYGEWTPRWWQTDSLWKKYAWQVSIYMLATSKRLRLIRFNRETKEWIDYYYTVPFHSLAEIRARILTIEALAAADELPECEGKDWGCPFSYLHTELEPVDEPELEKLVSLYDYHKRNRDAFDESMKKLREQIGDLLAGRPKVLLLSGVTVSRSEYDVKEHTVKGSKQVRLTITKPKDASTPPQ